MIQIRSLESYRELKRAAASAPASLGLVVHFAADWCAPCGAVRGLLAEHSKSLPALTFAEVNCEENEAICEEERITSVPLIAFFRPSAAEEDENAEKEPNPTLERVADVAGAKLELVEMNLRSLYGPPRADFASLDAYLRALTGRPGVVAFLTGTPSRPRCGFTSRLCELFQALGVRYLFYDVMASAAVCEGLKGFSNWPTFPQVYVDGALIGGYDVCRQLHEEGELRSTLIPGSES